MSLVEGATVLPHVWTNRMAEESRYRYGVTRRRLRPDTHYLCCKQLHDRQCM